MSRLTHNINAKLLSIASVAFFAAFSILAVLPMDQSQARGGGRGGGGRGGGGRGGGVSRPSGGGMGARPAPRPTPSYRPAPSTRPSYTPGTRPSTRPSYQPGTRPGAPGAGPGTRPPYQPGTRPPVNTGRGDINIDVDNGWGHGWDDDWGAFAAGAVVGGVTGAAIAGSTAPGTVVYSLPPSCTTVVVGGVPYQQCGNTYYTPSYQGSSVVYQAVPAP